jgi:hypothetical protein
MPPSSHTRIPSSPIAAAAVINALSLDVLSPPPALQSLLALQPPCKALLDIDAYTSAFSIKTANAVTETFTHGIALEKPSPFIVSAIAWAAPSAQ